MSRRRVAWMAGTLGALLLLAAGAGVVALQSGWFREQVRTRLVSAVETATGGRVEIGSFAFDWHRLRAEIRDFTLHGTEPAGKPPLLHADSIVVGLRIVSLLERTVDIAGLDVAAPHVYLTIDAEGRTNLPEPKVKRRGGAGTFESIMQLAIGRFSVNRGVFEVESRGATPFDARGRNLNAALDYAGAARDYRGSLAVRPLEIQLGGGPAVPVDVSATVTMSAGRIGIETANLATGSSRVDIVGGIENLASPRGRVQYSARVAAADVARLAGAPELRTGWLELAGEAQWAGGRDYSALGKLHVYGLEYRDSVVRIRDIRADGGLTAGPKAIELSGLRLAGNVAGVVSVEGRIARATLRDSNLDLAGLDLAALGGSFEGQARLTAFDRYHVEGQTAGLLASRLVALYSRARLPWDGRVSGPARLEGSLRRKNELQLAASLAVTPAADSAPVHGTIEGSFEARGGILDLGQSALALPSSRAAFSGALGRSLRVDLETRDLGEVLPAVGIERASAPVKLEHGTARFDGTVTGSLAHPMVAGHLSATNFTAQGMSFSSFDADVMALADNVSLRNATLARGAMQTRFQLALALADWKTGPHSQIFGNATVRNAAVAELASLAGASEVPLTGTLGASAQVAGTLANPLVDADLEITSGRLEDEPFDRFSGRLHATAQRIQLAGGQLGAGVKQVQVSAAYDRGPSGWNSGRLAFKVSTNAMPLDQVQLLAKARPGIGGTVEANASGVLNVAPPSQGRAVLRIGELHADLSAHGIQLPGQPVGSAHLTANSEGTALRAHLDWDFAGSQIRGDGQWRLEDDDPGTATIEFSKLDLAQLGRWSARPGTAGSAPFMGSAEGTLRIDGPALRPREIKAELSIPAFELHPAPKAGVPTGLALHNSGTLVLTMANSVVTVTSAHLVGSGTDFRVSGKLSLGAAGALGLHAAGRIDLSALQTLDADVTSSGTAIADATVRGSLSDPRIDGGLQIEKASFNIAGVPNGITNANGAILFSGDRATIQKFEGESGGGRVIVTGFGSFGGGAPVFRLHVRTEQVRVRYPEGVSTVADANLNLTGTVERNMLAGSVTVRRMGFNPQSDLSSVLARSSEPERAPSASTGLLGGMNFDVQIDTAPDIQVASSLTQDVGVEANLHLRGTAANPALLGRINVTQGQLIFFGTKYTISQGSISFYNPVRVEPILNIDLETKARGIDVTLNVSGPLNKLNLTPRSDPPLQFSEIVALLATGEAPTSENSQLTQYGPTQPWQQAGASALLGQAIASPVTGRLQRFFGVSRLRIDPTLPGVEYNPQARITLEQQVTPDITFTYITVVTSTNPQVVSVEWDFSRQWSAVAVREENGLLGLDFFVKRQFK
jgi:translocation and assembly module TamB